MEKVLNSILKNPLKPIFGISKILIPIEGLQTFFSMDNISGSALIDDSGNGNDFTITGAVQVPGKVGQGLRCDDGEYAEGVSVGWDKTVGSLACWVKRLEPNDELMMFSTKEISASGDRQWFEIISSQVQIHEFGGTDSFGNFTFGVDIWYFIVITWNATGRTCKVNNNTITLTNPTAVFIQNNDPLFRIGDRFGTTNNTNCVIDQWRLYNKVLTDLEQTMLWNSGAGI